jgi:hypothetical protein
VSKSAPRAQVGGEVELGPSIYLEPLALSLATPANRAQLRVRWGMGGHAGGAPGKC